jgi:O-antigen ligase
MHTEFIFIVIILIASAGACALYFCPQIAIGILLMIPLVKAAALSSIPFFASVDLTVLANVLAGGIGIIVFLRNRNNYARLALPSYMLLCLGLVGFVFIIGMLWTTAPHYGLQKLTCFIGIGIPFLILPVFFIRSTRHGILLMYVLIVVGAVVALVLLFAPHSTLEVQRYGEHYGRSTFFGSDPNTPAVIPSVGIIVLSAAVINGVASRWTWILTLISLPLSLAAILLTGSRAILSALMLGLIFVFFVPKTSHLLRQICFWFTVVSLILLVSFFLSPVTTRIPFERWSHFTHQLEQGDLTSTRTPAWLFCIENAWDAKAIFGHGPGSYSVDFLKKDEPLWPHNIVLEALYEGGIVSCLAIIFFFVVCLFTLSKGLRAANTPLNIFLIAAPGAVIIVMSVVSMTHWNLDGSRFLYLFAGILYANTTQVVMQTNTCDNTARPLY